LQVTWDEPDLLQGVSRVSPWQVELVATLPMQLPPFSLPKKKLRAAQPQELQAPGLLAGLPLPGSSSSSFAGHLPAPWGPGAATLLDNASAGMQGARHDRFNALPSVDFRNGSPYKRPRESTSQYEQDHHHRVFHPIPQAALSEPAASTTNNYFSLLPSHHHQRRPNLPPSIQPLAFMTSAPGSSQLESPPNKTTAATSFFLFGQFIDPSCASKSQQQQQQQQHSSPENDVSVAKDG
jgi:hypothetical protein